MNNRKTGLESTKGKNLAPDTYRTEKIEIRCLPARLIGISKKVTTKNRGKAHEIQDD